MAVKKQDDFLVIREIEYTIRLRDNDSGFHELRDLLRSELTRFEDTRKRSRPDENPIRQFLQTNIERSIAVREYTKVYFTSYKEKEGSFIIQFTLLVFTPDHEYASVRHVLDHLIKDTISEYFEELLERHLPVTVSVQWDERAALQQRQSSEQQPENQKERPIISPLSLILASVAIGLSILTAALLLFGRPGQPKADTSASDLQQKYNELLIEKKIDEALEEQQLNITVKQIADSVTIIRQAAPGLQPLRKNAR